MLLAVLFFRSFNGSSEPGTPLHRDSIPSKPLRSHAHDQLRGIPASPANLLRKSFQSSPSRARTCATSNHEFVVGDSCFSFSILSPDFEISVQKSRKPCFLAFWWDFSASPARLWALLT